MSSALKETDYILAKFVARGEGIGGLSGILIGESMLPLAAAAAILINAGHYIAFALLLVYRFPRVGFLIIPGILVYCLFSELWIPAALLALFIVIRLASTSLAMWNAKRLWLNGVPMIGPFEGAPDILYLITLRCVFLATGLLAGGALQIVAWGLFVLTSLWLAIRYAYRLWPRWRQIHSPLLFRYVTASFEELAASKQENREFDLDRAIAILLRTVYPEEDDLLLDHLVESINFKFQRFEDRAAIISAAMRDDATAKPEILEEMLDDIEQNVIPSCENGGLRVRWTIAEVVEQVHGVDQRANYLWAVLIGKAD